MLLIKKLEEQISDEIEDAEAYAKCALAKKDERPDLAKLYYRLSNDELEHMNELHKQVAVLINDYRDEHGEPPADMVVVYDYLHDEQIDEVNEIKMMLASYKE